MMDSLVNNLRLNGIIIVVELQIFVCIANNLLLISMVTLLTAWLVGAFQYLCGSCRIHTKCVLSLYTMENIAL